MAISRFCGQGASWCVCGIAGPAWPHPARKGEASKASRLKTNKHTWLKLRREDLREESGCSGLESAKILSKLP